MPRIIFNQDKVLQFSEIFNIFQTKPKEDKKNSLFSELKEPYEINLNEYSLVEYYLLYLLFNQPHDIFLIGENYLVFKKIAFNITNFSIVSAYRTVTKWFGIRLD